MQRSATDSDGPDRAQLGRTGSAGRPSAYRACRTGSTNRVCPRNLRGITNRKSKDEIERRPASKVLHIRKSYGPHHLLEYVAYFKECFLSTRPTLVYTELSATKYFNYLCADRTYKKLSESVIVFVQDVCWFVCSFGLAIACDLSSILFMENK